MFLDDMIAKLRHIKELSFTLFAGMHHLDAVEELVKVEATSVVVRFGTLQLPKEVYFSLGELVDSAATQFTLHGIKVVFGDPFLYPDRVARETGKFAGLFNELAGIEG